ncbi:hypothetical protein EJ08DRAFT_701654 [Tothia fuscella]|uniref:Uncharacterized protein n=1 Tax=Tothia fuscella TaxID=1048955 RepID=A0A9P4TU04_9PEZI|nr:hypothetical protein EJ08DRAFT_701654 [Tothia fuscella]
MKLSPLETSLYEYFSKFAIKQGPTFHNADYHLYKVRWPYQPKLDINYHPKMVKLRQKLDAEYIALYLCNLPSPGDKLTVKGFQLTLAGDIESGPDFDDKKVNVLPGTVKDFAWMEYLRAGVIDNYWYLGEGNWEARAWDEADGILDRHGGRYNMGSFHLGTFVDELVEGLLMKRGSHADKARDPLVEIESSNRRSLPENPGEKWRKLCLR